MIKAIIFDLGNVIVKVNRTDLYKEWAENSGKTAKEVMEYYSNSRLRTDFEKGRMNPNEFYEKIAQELGLKMSFREFKNSYCNIFALNVDVENAIKKLKHEFRLILLSNTDELHFEYVKNKFKVVSIFDDYVLSYKVSKRKPNPMIFWEAIRKSKTLPMNCLYFDDIPEFIIMARLMGVKAYQFKGFEKLRTDLHKNNVLSKPL